MARGPSALKLFIYDNLPYLLLTPLALALLFAEQEIGLSLSRSVKATTEGLTIGLLEQRLVAALILMFIAYRIWLGRRR